MFQNLWVTIACTFLSALGLAQGPITLKGQVLAAHSGEPLVGASVQLGEHYTITSPTGEFELSPKGPGYHTLIVSHLGYLSISLDIGPLEAGSPLKIELIEATTQLGEVQVFGKSEKRIAAETPTLTHTVSKAFLQANRSASLMQTLDRIPGVGSLKIGSGQSKPVIRGLGFNRVVVVQHGIKHEAQQWGNDHGLEIDQYGVENVQIIKGPASLAYGSDAIAGAVDLQAPALPQPHSLGGEVNLLAESNNGLLGVSTGIQGRREKWYFRGRMTYRDYGDYKVPTQKINYENYIFQLHDNHLRNTAGREANAALGIGYVAKGFRSQTHISHVYAKNGFFANAHGLEVRTSTIDYDRSSRDIDLPLHRVNHFKLTNNTSISLGDHSLYLDLGFQNNHRVEHAEPVPHGHMPRPQDSRERLFEKNTYTLNVRDRFHTDSGHELTAGLDLEYQHNAIGGWGFLIPGYERTALGGYALGRFGLGPDLHLLAGVRYDHGLLETQAYHDWYTSPVRNADGSTSQVHLQRSRDLSLEFGSLSASMGLSLIHGRTTYKVNLGKSFRMPLANELASDGVNYHMYRYERGSPDLDPESSYQLDLEVDHGTDRFRVVLSPFVNLFGNFIYLDPTSEYFETLQIYRYTQARVLRFGGELRASAGLTDRMRVDASLEYVHARQGSGPKKNFTLPFSPPLSGLLSLHYGFGDYRFMHRPRLVADLWLAAAQREIVPPESPTPGYGKIDLALLVDLTFSGTGRPMEFRVKLNNALNAKYYDHGSFYRLIDVPEAGRNLSVSMTIPFGQK